MSIPFAPLPQQTADISLRGVRWTLRLPTAAQLLSARQEASGLADLGDQALVGNACLLSRSLIHQGSPVFASGQAVLDTLTPQEIGQLTDRFQQLCDAHDPSPEEPVDRAQRQKEQLKQDSYGRLRWQVLRAFHALPTEERVQQMHPSDYLYCALNLILDQEETLERLCPSCREQVTRSCCPCCGTPLSQWQSGLNESFDLERFAALGREGRV